MLGSSCLVSLVQKENNEVTCDKTCKLSMLIFLQSSAIFWICKATFQRNLALCFSYAIAVCTTRLNKDVLALSVKFSFFFCRILLQRWVFLLAKCSNVHAKFPTLSITSKYAHATTFEFTSHRSDEFHRNEEIKKRQKSPHISTRKFLMRLIRSEKKIHHNALKVSSGLASENNPAVPAV